MPCFKVHFHTSCRTSWPYLGILRGETTGGPHVPIELRHLGQGHGQLADDFLRGALLLMRRDEVQMTETPIQNSQLSPLPPCQPTWNTMIVER